MSSNSRGREPGRKKTRAVVPDEESGEEEPLYAQPRPSHHPKTPQKPPTSIIKGDVHIKSVKGNVYLVQGSREEERPQRCSTPLRTPARRQQPTRTTKRLTAQYDSPTASEEDETTASDEAEPEYVAPKRSIKSIVPPDRSRMHSEKKKGDLPDEGYHTSGTVSYTAQVQEKLKGKGKGKEKYVSSAGGPSGRPRRDSKMSNGSGEDSDASSCHPNGGDGDELSAEEAGYTDQEEQTAPQEEDEASDDDFSKLPIHIGNPNQLDIPAIGETAILDTGSKRDWISQTFYSELRDIGVRFTKLTAEELELKYRDFNGKKFQPTAKVHLMIQTEEFKGEMKCRTMMFFVASKAKFTILFGRDTIRKHGFLTRGNRDTDGEGALIGVHDEMTEAQKALMRKQKEEQKKQKEEKKRLRDSKIEKAVKQKENASVASSSKVAAHLVTTVPRGSTSGSPPKESGRKSSSSMEDCTW